MTAQIAEKLYYEGQMHSMTSNPLGLYFHLAEVDPGFEWNCTALWRGYVGTWEIVENRLYLLELHGTLKNGVEASVATFFPDFPNRVYAHWYTGTIRIPQGKLLKYVHMGYQSEYEEDLFLEVSKGVITNTRICHNGTAEGKDGTSKGYGIGAMTVLPQINRNHENTP